MARFGVGSISFLTVGLLACTRTIVVMEHGSDAAPVVDSSSEPTVDASAVPDSVVKMAVDAHMAPDAAIDDCEANPRWRDCEGDVLWGCVDGEKASQDCRTAIDGYSASCGAVDSDHPTALTCKFPSGTPCLVEEGDGNVQLACAGPKAGCVYTGSASCRTNVGTCTAADVGTCRDQYAVLDCLVSQPLLFSCSTWGATCSGGVCRGASVGATCVPELIECESGAHCEIDEWEGGWKCVGAGDDCPAGCTSPPAGECQWSEIDGHYTAITNDSPGTCTSPPSGECSYPISKSRCAENCLNGACVLGPTCSLATGCTPPLGCKLVTDTEMRCIPVDDYARVGDYCDDEIPGYRCASHQKCIWPSFTSAPACAHLCLTNADCGGGGLLGMGICIKDGTAGISYGYCK